MAPVVDKVIVYDLVTETAHRFNHSAAELLRASSTQSAFGELISRWSAEARADHEAVEGSVERLMEQFREMGLIGRLGAVVTPERPVGSPKKAGDAAILGAAHPVVDHHIVFRSSQIDLVAAIDRHLGSGRDDLAPTLVFDVSEEPDGEILMETDESWKFLNLSSFLDQLPSVLDEYATWSHRCAVIHAGAVRSPGGDTYLFAGPSGHGKSTLTAAFVQAGWDYLGDEAIGVRPGTCMAVGYPKRLAIGSRSREVLGLPPGNEELDAGWMRVCFDVEPEAVRHDVLRLSGEVGPISAVMLAEYVDGELGSIERLQPDDAIIDLLANTVNLNRCRQLGLDALSDLAATVPVSRLRFSDARRVPSLLGDQK